MSRLIRSALAVAALAVAVPVAAFAQRPNPSQAETDQFRRRGPCSDPWVTIAVIQVNSATRAPYGAGDVGECDTSRYNGGRWSSFDELYRAVEADRRFLDSRGLQFYSVSGPRGGTQFVVVRQTRDGVVQGAALVGNDGSSFQFTFAQMVAAGAGNLIGQDGATIVGQNGSALITDGGSTMRTLFSAPARGFLSPKGGEYRAPVR